MTSENLPAVRQTQALAVRQSRAVERYTAPAVPVLRLGPGVRAVIAATAIVAPFAGLAITLIGQAP